MDIKDININDYNVMIYKNDYGDICVNLRKKIEIIEKEREERRKKINIDDDYNLFVGTIVETIYKKPNGEIIYKETTHRPWNYKNSNHYNYENTYLKPGMKNSYGHLVLDSYEQFYFKF